MMIEKELLERVKKETFVNYKNYDVVGGDDNKTYLPDDEIKNMLKDLLNNIGGLTEEHEYEVKMLKKELKKAKQPIEEDDYHEDYMLMKAGLI